jgi:hypothetical protein
VTGKGHMRNPLEFESCAAQSARARAETGVDGAASGADRETTKHGDTFSRNDREKPRQSPCFRTTEGETAD